MSQAEKQTSKNTQGNRPKCCLGTLYYSQSRHDSLKPPVCIGFGKRLRETGEPAELSTDSVPGGDFKYLCFGYSAYNIDQLKKAAQQRTSSTDPVQLPYCEGLEVVSAAAMSGKPELLTEGPNLPSSSSSSSNSDNDGETKRGDSVRQRQGRTFAGRPEFPPEGMDWDKFKERFDRMALRIAHKMQANAAYMVTSFKKSLQTVAREISGERDRDKPDS